MSRASFPARVQRFLAELKRRKVFQVTSVYLVAAWGLSAGGAEILPAVGLPDWTVRYLVIGAFAATPVVALCAWVYEFSDRGIERDPGPVRLTEQETVLANADQVPALTARWRTIEARFVRDFDIGRVETCALQLVDEKISRRHARVQYLNGHWQLQDLGSANGTELNGEKVSVATLKDGDQIHFYPGGAPLLVRIEALQSAQETVLAVEEPSAVEERHAVEDRRSD
ncbi:MAG: FHA domain-containing protein [Pseudomonadota bacterium]